MSIVENKLKELGYELPVMAKPVAAYVPGICQEHMIYTSGQLPFQDGNLRKGKVGRDLCTQDGYEAAEICALNCIAVLKNLAGDLDRIEQIIKVTGFVNSTEDYEDQPKVINGASELLGKVFGDKGIHSRCAVGVSSLPLGACCEIEVVAKIN